MITVIGDTHGREDHRLEGRAREAVGGAEAVLHTGDFTTAAVLDAFERAVGADVGGGDLFAVHGNNADPAVRERLPATRVVDLAGVRFVVVHGHDHDDTALRYLGRQADADVVVVGHSHDPGWAVVGGAADGDGRTGALALLNPGSHADPRWYRPAHAELEPTAEGLAGRLVSPDGSSIEEFALTVGERA